MTRGLHRTRRGRDPADVSRTPARARARRGLHGLGRGRHALPRPRRRPRGVLARPRPSRRRRRRSRRRRSGSATSRTCSGPSQRSRSPNGCTRSPGSGACSSATRAPRRSRPAIKLARRRGGERGGAAKHEIVCLDRAFHGRTIATLAAGASAAKRDPFGPVAAGFRHVAAERHRRAARRRRAADRGRAARARAGRGRRLADDAAPTSPRRGRSATCTTPCWSSTRCRPGIGRTGEWFAFQRLGVRPDAVCLAKGLGAGLPIGALVADEVGDGFQRGDHASTFGGSPPIAAAALAVLDAIEQEGLVENARTIGAHLAERAAAIPGVSEVRGLGLLLAVELATRAVERGRSGAACAGRAGQRDHPDGPAAGTSALPRRGARRTRSARRSPTCSARCSPARAPDREPPCMTMRGDV